MSKLHVVVADSRHARIYQAAGVRAPFEAVAELHHPDSRLHEGDLVTDKPGVAFDGRGIHGRHAMTGREDRAHLQEVRQFAKELADRIEEERRLDHFDRLMLVASPQFLGELRQHLSASTRRLVEKEINKSVVDEDGDAIRRYLM